MQTKKRIVRKSCREMRWDEKEASDNHGFERESQTETVPGSRKQKIALSGESLVSDIQMGAASPCGWSSTGEGGCGKGERSHQWTLDMPNAGGKKECGKLGSVGTFPARCMDVWTYSTPVSLIQSPCACSHPGDGCSRVGRDMGCIAFSAGTTG